MNGPAIGANGWLAGAVRRRSPNFDTRPEGTEIDLVVVHGISLPPGEFGSDAVSRLFCNDLDPGGPPALRDLAGNRVSAHVFIDRTGRSTQYVSFLDRAWHAGESSYCGRAACNDYSIGIELEGTDTVPYESSQYDALAGLVRSLMARWPGIRPDRIVGHADIAPGRKTDPGPSFDWARFRRLLDRG